jgi:hypothetical protein
MAELSRLLRPILSGTTKRLTPSNTAILEKIRRFWKTEGEFLRADNEEPADRDA